MARSAIDAELLRGSVAGELLASADPVAGSQRALGEVKRGFNVPIAFFARRPNARHRDALRPWHVYAAVGTACDGLGFAVGRDLEKTVQARTARYAQTSALPDSPLKSHLSAANVDDLVLVPLVDEDEVIGLLALASDQPIALDAIDASCLLGVATVWSGWLRQLLSRERDRVETWRHFVIRDAAHQIAAGLPFRVLLRRLVEKACALTGARYGALGVRTPDGRALSDFIHVGFSDAEVAGIGHLPVGHGLLGAVLESNSPIRVARINAHPPWCGFPPNHPPMTSFLGVPLRIDGQVFGNFYLTEKHNAPEFTAEDEETIELFAAYAALVVGYARAADMATRERALLAAFVQQSPTGVMFFRSDGEFGFSNPAAEKMAGRVIAREPLAERAVIYGVHYVGDGTFAPEDLPAARALRGESVRNIDAEFHRPDGTVLPVQISATPVRTDGDKIAGAVVEFHDRSAAKELDRLREEFAAVVAHDLRNPITSILTRTQLLLESRADGRIDAAVTSIEAIRRCAQRLNQMTDDLLDAARIESARITLEQRRVTLASVIESVLGQLRPMLGDHEVHLHFDGDAPAVAADPLRLEQILVNIIENAAKYSPATAPIDITVRPAFDGASVSVSDYGMGIEPEEIPHLFNRFYQTNRARARKTGLGLGLYITRGLVEAHGGAIRVESTPNVGTTFEIWLPRFAERVQDAHPAP